jgi:hypothetical protein
MTVTAAAFDDEDQAELPARNRSRAEQQARVRQDVRQLSSRKQAFKKIASKNKRSRPTRGPVA